MANRVNHMADGSYANSGALALTYASGRAEFRSAPKARPPREHERTAEPKAGMEPLDLRIAPPRGPREKLLGLSFIPRTIGNTIGSYPPEQRVFFNGSCRGADAMPEDMLVFDVIEMDDAKLIR